MKLKRLLQQLPGCEFRGDPETEIRGIADHSRRVEKGFLFAALPGRNCSGLDFVSEAIDRGAAALLLADFFSPANGRIAQLKAGDPRRALAAAANEFFGHPSRKMRVVGVTGTNGKTTVTMLVRAIFEAAGQPSGLIGTIDYRIGSRILPSDLTTPPPPRLQSLLEEMRKAGCRRVLMEVSSHALDQGRVEGIEFSAAVFTNLTPEHLDYHRDLEDYGRTKLKLFASLSSPLSEPGRTPAAIVNLDDGWGERMAAAAPGRVVSYGFTPGVDLRAERVELSPEGSRFLVSLRDGSLEVAVPLLGRHNVLNALAAIAVGLDNDVPPAAVVSALAAFAGIPGRLEPVRAGQDFHVLIDYAHTPAALESTLRTIREIFSGRLIAVFGCGGDRDRGKRPRMGAIAERAADVVILTSDNPRSEDPEAIIGDIRAGMRGEGGAVFSNPSRREAIAQAVDLASAGDVVLIAGKGHEQQQTFADRVVPFSDRQAARDILGGGRP